MQSAYSAVERGSANSAVVVAWPLMNFQISLSLLLSALFLISKRFFCAVRQLCGALGHTELRHESVPSLQMNAHGAVPGEHVPDEQVSAPLQNSPSEHEVPSGCFASAGQLFDDPSHVSATSQAPTAARQTVV